MKNLFELLKIIEEEEFADITNFAKMDEKNEKFVDFEYFTIEKENMFFYIEKTTIADLVNGINGKYSVTAYKKIDYNHKQQLSYPKGFNTCEELKEIVKNMIKEYKYKNVLKNTYKQDINYELKQYVNTKFGKLTILQYLKKIAGYREQEILKNINKITMNLNNKDYLVFEFYDKKNNSFAINTKNLERLIIS